MRQNIKIRNVVDGDGNPAGGLAINDSGSTATLVIHWQDGPVKDDKPNGAFVEDVIEIAQTRLEFYQRSKFACIENATAIACLQRARDELARRFERREAAGTANSYEGN